MLSKAVSGEGGGAGAAGVTEKDDAHGSPAPATRAAEGRG